MSAIVDVHAREILDSRGNPTVEVEIELETGAAGRAAVPSGASTGAFEAVERRDGDAERYGGKGVLNAVEAVNNEIFEALSGMDADEQVLLDERMIELDGTQQGAARSECHSRRQPCAGQGSGGRRRSAALPLCRRCVGPCAAGSDDEHPERRRPCRQSDRFPRIHGYAGRCRKPVEAVRWGAEIFHALRTRLSQAGHNTNVGDEGGFAPDLGGTRDALDFVMQAIGEAGFKVGEEVHLALDAASTEFFKDGKYHLEGEGKVFSAEEMATYYGELCGNYPIISIEDGLAEADWDGWKALTDSIGDTVQLVGDDLFVTNPARLADGISRGVANSILVKVNQIGTLTETLAAVEAAHKASYTAVMSHRSGETEDTTIADLAVATNCGQIKTGSLARSDRLAKYNQLIRIEEDLGPAALYAGRSVLPV